jgi:hypothetical protein
MLTMPVAAERAGREMLALTQGAIGFMGGIRASVGEDAARLAWILSITTSMKESVPRKSRSRRPDSNRGPLHYE